MSIAEDLDGAIRAFAGMCAVYDMPEKTAKAMGAFAETLGEIAAAASNGQAMTVSEQEVEAALQGWIMAASLGNTKEQLRAALLAAAAARPAQADGWQPITTAPKNGTRILVPGGIAYWRDRHHDLMPGWFTITAEAWPGKRIQWSVDHWMPFPTPPQLRADDEGSQS